MVFLSTFMRKTHLGMWTPFLGSHGWRKTWLMAAWKAHGRLFIRVIWTFFAIYYGSGVMRLYVYNSDVFTGGRPLCTQTLSGNQRHWATRWWRPHPFAFPRFNKISECDGQTDGQTDGYAVANTALAKLALRSAVKTIIETLSKCSEQHMSYNLTWEKQFISRNVYNHVVVLRVCVSWWCLCSITCF